MINHSRFRVITDQDKQLCFVGLGGWSRKVAQDFQDQHALIVSVEDLSQQTPDWFASKQFIVITSDVSLQKRAVAHLDRYHVDYFSLIHCQTDISDQTKIGVGTIINAYTLTLPNEQAVIGNHCTLGSHVSLSDQVVIHDFCHISPQCYINHCEIFEGSVIGVQSKIAGQVNQNISIAPFSNVMMNSMVTKSITKSGTYFNNRRVNCETSLDHRIL